MNADNHDTMLIGLLERIAQQDAQALKALYDECAGKLYGLALRVVTQREFAEDVLQEVYITVWSKADRFDASRASPITWLVTIARNRSIDRVTLRDAAEIDLDLAWTFAPEAAGVGGQSRHLVVGLLEGELCLVADQPLEQVGGPGAACSSGVGGDVGFEILVDGDVHGEKIAVGAQEAWRPPNRGAWNAEGPFRGLLCVEREMGIEPTLFAWEARVLPLNDTREAV